MKKFSGKIVYLDHHLAHIASSSFFSNFDKSVNLSIDGFGDFLTDIETSKKKYFPSSKDKRFTEVIIQTRREGRIKNIRPYTLGLGNGCIINYEQFRLYTLSLYYLIFVYLLFLSSKINLFIFLYYTRIFNTHINFNQKKN